MKRKINVFFALVAVLLLTANVNVNAQIEKTQASYIYNFTRFIEWPSAGSSEFVIAIIGKNHPLTAELKATSANRSVGTLPVKIVEYASADLIEKCNILFVPDAKSAQLKKVDEKLHNKTTIVVTEEQGWNPAESTINLQVVDSKLTFSINREQINQKSMKVSDKLLALSK